MYFVDIGQCASIPFEVWNALPADQRPKRPAIFMEGNTDGEQMTAGLKALAEKYGYKIVLTESLPVGGTDFSQQIMKAKSAGVDAILSMTTLNDAITLVSQMKAMKFNVKYFQGWKGHWSMAFYESLGKSTENIMCDGFWSMDYPFAGAKALGERYHKEQGGYSVSIGTYYALCQTLWQAIEKAGTLDGAKIRQAVIDNQFDTVNGKVDYDEKGIAIFPMADFQWRNGKQTVIYPTDLSSTKVEQMAKW
jgi:branched-chain amino acid transport system substrate-binding protein